MNIINQQITLRVWRGINAIPSKFLKRIRSQNGGASHWSCAYGMKSLLAEGNRGESP